MLDDEYILITANYPSGKGLVSDGTFNNGFTQPLLPYAPQERENALKKRQSTQRSREKRKEKQTDKTGRQKQNRNGQKS